MTHAKNECRHSTQGHTWSMKLVAVEQMVQYWKMHRSNLRNTCEDKTLLDIGKSLDIKYNDTTLSKIDTSITKA
eukprot:11004660-Ditylum_brightwellii.AAC.2